MLWIIKGAGGLQFFVVASEGVVDGFLAGSTVVHFFGEAVEGLDLLLAFFFLHDGLVEGFGFHVAGPFVEWEVTMVDVGCEARRGR